MDKLKIAIVILWTILIISASYGLGRLSAVQIADTHGDAYKVYICEDTGAATIEVRDVNLISEGHSGLFVSNGR